MYDYDVLVSMNEAYDEALAVDYPCPVEEEDLVEYPWEDDMFLEGGLTPTEGAMTGTAKSWSSTEKNFSKKC